MSILKIYSEDGSGPRAVMTDIDSIAARLQAAGVRFERWQAKRMLANTASQEEVIEAYSDSVDRLMTRYGFKSVDVVSLRPDHPDREAFRRKFLNEHIHKDYEVRFFVDGRGLFYLHVEDEVYAILCECGDLISIPADTKHWFDMGAEPFFKCIRLFTTPEGWVAEFTGDTIASRFPSFDDFIAEAA